MRRIGFDDVVALPDAVYRVKVFGGRKTHSGCNLSTVAV